MATKKAKPPQTKTKSAKRELFSWIFDLTYFCCLIYFFSSPANTYKVWNWVCTNLEGPTVQLISSLPKAGHQAAPPPQVPLYQPPPLSQQAPSDAPATQAESSEPTSSPQIDSQTNQPADVNIPTQIAAVPRKSFKIVRGKGKPIQFGKGKINGVPFYQTIINLKDPETFIRIGLPNKATMANAQGSTYGHENFDAMVKHFPGAVLVNGTFFSKDKEERVMGNMVSEGRFLKYSQWENYGTTLGLKAGNEPEMITARSEGQPNWQEHWFSLTCGPRLVKQGEVWLAPDIEGFTDDHVLSIGPRAAIGFPKSKDKLYIITFMNGLSLEQEAKLMKEIGCYEAMNLDGGASKALARDGKIVVTPGRALTNVIVVYDTKHPAPEPVVASWMEFQDTNRADGI